MSIIEAVRNYIASCPLLKDGRILGVDRVGADAIEYSIDVLPSEPVLKKYVDGSKIKQFQFAFSSREAYGRDVVQSVQNSAFYEDFADWVGRNDDAGIYPDLGDLRPVRSIELTSGGYAIDVTETTARYQIEMRLTYLESWRYLKNGKRN